MKSEYEIAMGEFEGVRRGDFGGHLWIGDGTDDVGGEGQQIVTNVGVIAKCTQRRKRWLLMLLHPDR